MTQSNVQHIFVQDASAEQLGLMVQVLVTYSPSCALIAHCSLQQLEKNLAVKFKSGYTSHLYVLSSNRTEYLPIVPYLQSSVN